MEAGVGTARRAAFAYVVAASLAMCGLQLVPWSSPFLAGFFNAGDTPVYAVHGSWIETGRVPYVQIPIPYPPLDVVWNGLPHLLPLAYRDAFVVLSFTLFFALLALYGGSVRRGSVAATSASILLLGLPSVLYNVATFHDLRPAGVVLAAFLCLRAQRFEAAVALLAASVFLKTYPVVLLPVAFAFAVSQGLAPDALATPAARVRAYLGALVRGPGLRLVLVAVAVALTLGGIATGWTGASWLTVPAPNYGHRNPENPAYWLATYTPLGWAGALALVRALAAATVLGALTFVPLRRFDDAVRVAVVAVIAASLALPFHSPHWNLWFFLLLCLLPISRPLFLLLVAYDLVNLLFWPLFSYVTPIEAAKPVAEVVWPYLVLARCALDVVLVVWLLRDARRPGPEPCSGAAAGLYSGA